MSILSFLPPNYLPLGRRVIKTHYLKDSTNQIWIKISPVVLANTMLKNDAGRTTTDSNPQSDSIVLNIYNQEEICEVRAKYREYYMQYREKFIRYFINYKQEALRWKSKNPLCSVTVRKESNTSSPNMQVQYTTSGRDTSQSSPFEMVVLQI